MHAAGDYSPEPYLLQDTTHAESNLDFFKLKEILDNISIHTFTSQAPINDSFFQKLTQKNFSVDTQHIEDQLRRTLLEINNWIRNETGIDLIPIVRFIADVFIRITAFLTKVIDIVLSKFIR